MFMILLRPRRAAWLGLIFTSVSVAADAQTTVTLPAVTWGTVRAGAYANSFQGDLLATRASDTPDYLRRAMLKFDTQNGIPAGESVTSAILSVTISYANSGTARHVGAYPITDSFGDRDFSWNYRRISIGQRWNTPGGDLGPQLSVQTVGSTVGTTVRFDVTALVRGVVAGNQGSSRYTRVALIDLDAASRDSYREYGTPTAADAPTRPTLQVTYGAAPAPTATVPSFSRVFVIVMENKEYGDIIGNAAAPFINNLASRYGLATSYTAVAHPSLPDYMALTGGATVFTTDCQGCTTGARNIVDEVYDSGRHWKAYMESMPVACDTTDSGLYAQKHNPFVHYTDIVGNTSRCASKVVPFTDFDADLQNLALPDYVWITPNVCNDMHDCSVSTGDTWLSQVVPQITSSPAFTNAVLFLVWDEGTSTTGGGGHVPLIVVSSRTPAGTRVSTPYNHYSLLATIEQAWGLPRLANTAGAAAMADFFK
jgi:hypothetical protein